MVGSLESVEHLTSPSVANPNWLAFNTVSVKEATILSS